MKKTIVIFSLLMCVLCLSAKDDNVTLSFLRNEGHINVMVSYDNVKLNDVSESEFMALTGAPADTIYFRMIRFMNKKFSSLGIEYGYFETANYLIHIQLVSVDDDGAVRAKVAVVDMQNVSQIVAFKAHAHGGMIGSFQELFTESMSRLGENIADTILDYMK